jgi:3',5'-cyclic AMP phosphodiesterase CpdA
MTTPQPTHPTRRSVLAAGLVAGASASLAPAAFAGSILRPKRRVLRLAHLTDTHVQPEKGGAQGFAASLAHAQSQPKAPELIIFGGDNVMNVDGDGGRERAPVQLDTWNAVVRNDLGTPARYAIGNHDILALDPVDGKKWATDAFGLDTRYYTFETAGWRFVVLDSTSPNTLRGGDGGYKGLLDDEQFDWLDRTLRDTPAATPVCVVSHIPILAACAFFDGDNETSGDWRVPGAWMHLDARRIKDLFHRHKNAQGTSKVRLCLSGHVHLADSVEYLGITYACNGAVSGGWWGGPYQEFEPGYALVDLYDDGTSSVEYVTYGWTPKT